MNVITLTRTENKPLEPSLFQAALKDDIGELESAISLGHRLDATASHFLNMTPLHLACTRESNNFIEAALAEESCDVWKRDDNMRTAFDHAAARNNQRAMRLLYKAMHPDHPEPV
jgi:ankyrin repeat protein